MFKSAVLASLVAVSGMFLAPSDASAGHPYCGPSHGSYHGYAPVLVNPYSVGRVGFGTPYIGPDRFGRGFGYGNPGYRSYRAPVGVGGYPYGFGGNPYGFGGNPYGFGGNPYGFGGNPYGFSNFGGYNNFRSGSGFSLFMGR